MSIKIFIVIGYNFEFLFFYLLIKYYLNYSILSGGKTQKIVDLHLSKKLSKVLNY